MSVTRTLCCNAPSPEALAALRQLALKMQDAAKELSVVENNASGIFSARLTDVLYAIDQITATVKR